jgi:hypothetical protein
MIFKSVVVLFYGKPVRFLPSEHLLCRLGLLIFIVVKQCNNAVGVQTVNASVADASNTENIQLLHLKAF